jgi:hypothetical protein
VGGKVGRSDLFLVMETFWEKFSNLLAASRMDVENLKSESFPNKTIYSSFQTVEATDF